MNSVIFDQLKIETIHRIVFKELIVKYAVLKGIYVHPEDLNKKITALKKQYSSAQNFKEEIKKSQQTEKQWKSDLNLSLLEKLVVNHIEKQKSDQFKESQLREYYSKNKTSYSANKNFKLLIITLSNKEKAKKAQEALRNGYSTSYLINKKLITSESIQTANLRQLDKTPWSSLKRPGSVSSVINDTFGFQIAKLTGITNRKTKKFEDVKASIKRKLVSDLNINYEQIIASELNIDIKLNNKVLNKIEYKNWKFK